MFRRRCAPFVRCFALRQQPACTFKAATTCDPASVTIDVPDAWRIPARRVDGCLDFADSGATGEKALTVYLDASRLAAVNQIVEAIGPPLPAVGVTPVVMGLTGIEGLGKTHATFAMAHCIGVGQDHHLLGPTTFAGVGPHLVLYIPQAQHWLQREVTETIEATMVGLAWLLMNPDGAVTEHFHAVAEAVHHAARATLDQKFDFVMQLKAKLPTACHKTIDDLAAALPRPGMNAAEAAAALSKFAGTISPRPKHRALATLWHRTEACPTSGCG